MPNSRLVERSQGLSDEQKAFRTEESVTMREVGASRPRAAADFFLRGYNATFTRDLTAAKG